jgi:hypothetical protein
LDLVLAASASGLSTISVTDHDTTAGLREARAAADAHGLEFVDGLEISAVDAGRDVHMLGYFITIDAAALRALLERQRSDRLRRVEAMRDRLSRLGVPIDAAPVFDAARSGQTVGRPQIADALIAAGHVKTRDEAFARYLANGGAAHVPRAGVSPESVIEVIHAAGGLASLAHPGVARQDDCVRRLAAAGLDAIEAHHPEHDAALSAHYRDLARDLRLLVTGGSDFHGAGSGARHAGRPGAVVLPADDFARLRSAAAARAR